MWQKGILIKSIKLMLVVLGTIGIIFLLGGKIIAGVSCLAVLVFSLWPRQKSGLKQPTENERWVVEFLGEFYGIYGPGIIWILPILTKAREVISLSEQRYTLWEKPIKVDFIDGSATPKDAEAFVQVIGGREWLVARAGQQEVTKDIQDRVKESVYKVAYAPRAVKGATISTVENAARSYLNSLKIDDGLEGSRAGYDLLNNMEQVGKGPEAQRLKDSLANWGIQLNRVTIGDYDLDKETIDARRVPYQAARAAIAARSRALQRALESGEMHGQIKKVLTEQYGHAPEKADELAREYVLYWKGSEEKVMTQWRFEGEGSGGIYSEIAKIVTMIEAAKRVSGDKETKKGEKKGDKKEDKEEEKREEED